MRHKSINELVIRPAPGKKTEAILQAGHLTFRASLGRSGRTSRKREGDGATPIGTMPILYGYFRRDHGTCPKTSIRMLPIQKNMLWCDASGDANYNRPVKAPFKKSHEKLKRTDALYDICIVLDWNFSSRKQGGGSAIFFHIARDGYEPTEGCVALKRRDMERLLPLLKTGLVLKVM